MTLTHTRKGIARCCSWLFIASATLWITPFDCSARDGQPSVAILEDPEVVSRYPLPDFSYAGYGFGEIPLPILEGTTVDVRDYGAVANDAVDDSAALLAALSAASRIDGPVVVLLPPGRLIVSAVLRIERGNIVLRGHGQGEGGSELYFPRPLQLVEGGHDLDELREYLVKNDKRQVEPTKNIDAIFSEYSWSGGFIWVQKPGTRPAPYLEGKDPAAQASHLTDALQGRQGDTSVRVASGTKLAKGDVVQVRWFNRAGPQGPLLRALYGDTDIVIGSRHWTYPERALVIQTTRVRSVLGDLVTLGDPLLHDIDASLPADVASWEHLQDVGIEGMALVFPPAPSHGHHLEQGYNGIYFTSVFNGWVRDLRIENADSGVLTYNSASLTVADVVTEGDRVAHYSVHVGNAHNVLVSDLKVRNPVIHSLSVNTQATRSVFLRAEVFEQPTIDQHGGANHQNLFDSPTLHVTARRDHSGPWYPIWDGSGAGYWQPGHGRFNTTWNLRVMVHGGATPDETVRLVGAEEGPDARIVGVSGNRQFEVDYRPSPYLELINQRLVSHPSLYEYQLARRLKLARERRP